MLSAFVFIYTGGKYPHSPLFDYFCKVWGGIEKVYSNHDGF